MDRTRLARLLPAVPLLATGIALGRPLPARAATPCTTDIAGGTIRDSVVVTAGGNRNLDGVTVRGGVTVEPGAIFSAYNRTEIRGQVAATAPEMFFVNYAVVRGGVTAAGATHVKPLTTNGSVVRGDLAVTGNATLAGFFLALQFNTVRCSVVLRDNTATGLGTSSRATPSTATWTARATPRRRSAALTPSKASRPVGASA